MHRLLALVVVAALAAGVVVAAPSSAQKGPIKIGMLVPQTGPLAANGKDMINGFELFFEEQKYRLAGREVKFIVEDDEGKPATGITKARGLVESQGVHLLTGPLSAAVGYAVSPYIESKKIPAIYPIVSADDLTQRKRNPYLVRTGWASSQPMHALGDYAAKTLKHRRVAAIAMDNNFGHEGIGGFQRVFEDAGGRVVQKTWVPLNAMDFAPYLTQVSRDVDAVVQGFVAGQAVRFAKQYGEALGGRVPLIGTGVFTD